MMFTNDPVKDAENWFGREDPRPILGNCPICGEPVYGEDDGWDADDAYELDGEVIHSDCVFKYLDKNGYKI